MSPIWIAKQFVQFYAQPGIEFKYRHSMDVLSCIGFTAQVLLVGVYVSILSQNIWGTVSTN